MSATYETQHPGGFKDVGGYNYTRPRQPIAAMFSSPGPCYGLPGLVGQQNHDTRSIHRKYPGWHFGIRHGKFRDDCSPGPCYFPDSKIYRDGKDGTPHYSLHSRNQDLKGFAAPGPGAYCPEATGPSSKKMPPAFSFGIRHRSRMTDQTPAPNKYTLDGMLGKTIQSGKPQAPVISVRGRSTIGSFHEDLQKTPGPKYNVVNPEVYMTKVPHYSLTSRNTMPGDSTKKPGPGAHSPEIVTVNRRSAPAASFGMRHSQYICLPINEPTD